MTNPENILAKIGQEAPDMSRAFRQIASFLEANPSEFIKSPMRKLSNSIGVSEPSLIRFSRHFGYKGIPDFRIAVAMSLAATDTRTSNLIEPSLTDKEVVNRTAKHEIAALAATFVPADTSILLDSGSTVQFMAEQLVDAPSLTIMTTGLNTLLILKNSDQHVIMLPGGVLRKNAMSLSGRLVENSLTGMSFDTVYLGADSIHPDFGLSTFSEEEAHLNRAMIRASRRVVVLADSSKFKSPALHKICDLSEVAIVVSDEDLPVELQTAITAVGPELHLAKLK